MFQVQNHTCNTLLGHQLIYLTISSGLCTLLDKAERRHKSRRYRKSRRVKQATNKWYKLFTGALVGMAGAEKDIKDINECLPDNWKIENKKEEKPQSKDDASTFTKALDILEKVIKFVCKFKEKIKSLFSRKLKRMNKKVFLQRYKSGKNFFDDIADGISNIGNMITQTWEQVKDFGSKVVSDITAFYTKIKATIAAVLDNEFVKAVMKIVDCVKLAKKEALAIYKVIQGIGEKFTMIAAGGFVGLGKVFVDLICNFDKFRKAVGSIVDGINEADVPTKYYKYGFGLGTLVNALGTKKFRRLMKAH